MKFVRLAHEVDAILYTGDNVSQMQSFIGRDFRRMGSSIGICDDSGFYPILVGEYVVQEDTHTFRVWEPVEFERKHFPL